MKDRQDGGMRRTNGKKDIAEAISRSVLFFQRMSTEVKYGVKEPFENCRNSCV